jgi:putative ABC transport system permease protein
MGISPSRPIVAALLISNALVSLAGAAMAQLQRYADISMGDGTLVYSLAAIILGRAVFRNRRRPAWLVIATITGSVIYQLSIYGALRGGLPPVELRILTASLIFVVLALPRLLQLLHAGHRTTSR